MSSHDFRCHFYQFMECIYSIKNRQGWITSPRERTIHTEIFFVLVGAVTISIYSHSPHIAFIKTEMTIMVVRQHCSNPSTAPPD